MPHRITRSCSSYGTAGVTKAMQLLGRQTDTSGGECADGVVPLRGFEGGRSLLVARVVIGISFYRFSELKINLINSFTQKLPKA
ncbi:MAG: hypothetical protein V7K41_20085 [Nostoc sp.]